MNEVPAGRSRRPTMLIIYAAHTNTLQKEIITRRNFEMLLKSHSPFEIEYRVVDSDCCDRLVGVDWLPGPLTQISNDGSVDTGKWLSVMKKEKLDKFDYVTLINDSILLLRPVPDYMHFVATSEGNKLYGLLSSRQYSPHLQSWFRSIPKSLIEPFIRFIENKIAAASLGGWSDDNKRHILEFEIGVCRVFPFAALYNIPHTKDNIMFANKELYNFVRDGFPALKVKRINNGSATQGMVTTQNLLASDDPSHFFYFEDWKHHPSIWWKLVVIIIVCLVMVGVVWFIIYKKK